MAYQEAGGVDTYIADYTASGNLVSEFSRNIKSFPINQYSEIRPVVKQHGFYVRINPEQASRLLFSDARDSLWPAGADSPTGIDNLSQFTSIEFLCQRHARAKTLPLITLEQTAWDVAGAELRALGQQMMTEIVSQAFATLAATSWGNNTATAGVLIQAATGTGSKTWADATVNTPYIRQSVAYAAGLINVATGGTVRPNDLVLVFDPFTAIKLSGIQEINAALSNSVYTLPMIEGALPGGTFHWNLPPTIGGVRVVVDDTVVTTTGKGASTLTQGYVNTVGNAYLLMRRENEMVNPQIQLDDEARTRGDQVLTDEQREATPIYSTLARMSYTEFKTENKVEQWQDRTTSRVTCNYQWQVTSPLSGFAITTCF